jgi:hypothetical protein
MDSLSLASPEYLARLVKLKEVDSPSPLREMFIRELEERVA